MFTRRTFTLSLLGAAAMPQAVLADTFEVTRTDAEWQAMLTDLQYQVMRHEATERAGISPLEKNYADGVYHCRGCDLVLYASDTKYDSGTGWPSFYASLRMRSGPRPITRCSGRAQNAIAGAAAAILGTSLTMVPPRLANGIA